MPQMSFLCSFEKDDQWLFVFCLLLIVVMSIMNENSDDFFSVLNMISPCT